MRQCELKRETTKTFGWIDVKKTDEGRYVDLKDGGPSWLIAKVFDPEFSKKWISERSRDHKNMRKVTDI